MSTTTTLDGDTVLVHRIIVSLRTPQMATLAPTTPEVQFRLVTDFGYFLDQPSPHAGS